MEIFEHQGKVRALYHISVGISDIERTRRFYTAVLDPLGYRLMHEVKDKERITSLGWGLHFPELWTNIPLGGASPQPGAGVHVCFHAPSSDAVDGFYRAALLAGGSDNGPPGYRAEYDAGYYAAFVFDPDRNRLEAMWFDHATSLAAQREMP
jgi:catechol 2,3-dioxygenase-like lactoylglutathione lyase family enzyme